MKSDADIELERAAMTPIIGSTHAEWYADACRVEMGDPSLLQACRVRELAGTKARDVADLARALRGLLSACSHLDECGGQRVRDAMDTAETVLDVLFG